MSQYNVDFLVQSIQNSMVNEKNGTYYQKFIRFFPGDFLKKLVTMSTHTKLVKLEHQEHRPRLRVDYDEMISRELNLLFKSSKITEALSKKFNVTLEPGTADIWLDYSGYNLSPHRDDARVKLALQIYFGSGENPGTVLFDQEHDPQIIETFEYKVNMGYALLNNDKSWHGTDGTVTNNVRKSVYIRYYG